MREQSVWVLALLLGFAGGGDEVATATLSDNTTQTLNAGTGVSVLLGLDLAVARSGAHTLFVGAQGGVKGWNIGGDDTDFGLELRRFPMIMRLAYAFEVGSGLYVLTSGGLQYELGVKVIGSGVLEGIRVNLDNALGWMGEVGVLIETGRAGVTLALRYTGLSYNGADLIRPLDGSSIGVFLGFQGAFVTEDRPPLPSSPSPPLSRDGRQSTASKPSIR